MCERHLSDTVVVDADPQVVYDLVTDVTRTGEWSPVCVEAWWDEGEGPREGAWIGGRNQSDGRSWETRSKVLVASPGREFRWQVGGEFVTWAYLMRPVESEGRTATELTETWDLNDATVQRFVDNYGDRAEEVLGKRRDEARAGIPETLARIKQIAER